VESKAGIRPDVDDVADFLAGLGSASVVETTRIAAPRHDTKLTPRPISQRTTSGSSRSGTLLLRGNKYPYSNAKDAMVLVLRELAKTDPSFLERCSQHPDTQGRKRRYIARTAEELYPDRDDLRDMRESLPGGW